MARRTKTFSEGLARRFDKAKDYPREPDNRTLEKLLIIYETPGTKAAAMIQRSEKLGEKKK